MRTDIKVTYADYRTLPETGPRYQLIEGELLMCPAPSLRHQMILARLLHALYRHVEERRLGVVLCSPLDVILTEENVVQPDIVYVSADRRAILAPEGLRGAPDLCVEILSPKTRELDLGVKRVLYARHGMVEYWVVDADENTISVYPLQQAPAAPPQRLTVAGVLSTNLLPGFRCELSGLFAP